MSLVDLVEPVPAAELGRTHFIGIGGAGMSGIARIMLSRGIAVSGSDARPSELLDQLRSLGAAVHVGHDASHVGSAETVVVSTAIRDTNPELTFARSAGLRVLPRAAALASVMMDRRGIAVAGTHGKTTITSMLTVMLQRCGADPSYVVGGKLVSTGLGADEGTGPLFVAEADESDGSFLMLSPEIAVVSNVEADHLDNYGDPEAVHDGFRKFAGRVGKLLVVCVDDPGAAALAAPARDRGLTVRTYGCAEEADYRVRDARPDGFGMTAVIDGYGSLSVSVPGLHNVLNAAAAVAVGGELGLRFSDMAQGLAEFTGAERRFEHKGWAGDVAVYDSYAHHPTELAADLRAAREVTGGRVIAVFQPHLYSRTRFFAREFGTALGLADEAVVLDVYGAREDPEPGVSGAMIAAEVPGGRVTYVPERSRVPTVVAGLARPGDIVLTMGAGDVTELGPEIVEQIGGRAG